MEKIGAKEKPNSLDKRLAKVHWITSVASVGSIGIARSHSLLDPLRNLVVAVLATMVGLEIRSQDDRVTAIDFPLHDVVETEVSAKLSSMAKKVTPEGFVAGLKVFFGKHREAHGGWNLLQKEVTVVNHLM